jgi:hypothetical protein
MSTTAPDDPGVFAVQPVRGADDPRSADRVDSLSMFEPEHPSSAEAVAISLEPPLFVAPVRSARRRFDATSVRYGGPSSTDTSSRRTNHQRGDSAREEDAELLRETLNRLCHAIETRLVRAEAALYALCDVASAPLNRVSVGIDSRLTRTEDALARSVQHAMELGRHIDARFAQTEKLLQREHDTITETNSLRELCARIDQRLSRTEEALRSTEGLAADIEAIHRIVRSLENAQSHQLPATIDNRFALAEERLRALESVVEARHASEAPTTGVLDRPVWRGTGRMRRAGRSTIAVVRLQVAQTVSYVRFVMQRCLTIAATTSDASASRRVSRRVAPWAVLVAAVGLVNILRSDARIDTLPPLSVEPSIEKEVAAGSVTLPAIEASRPVPTAPIRATRKVVPPRTSGLRQSRPVQQPAEPSEFLGSLSVVSEPSGATVSINGQRVGVTPLKLPDRPAGSLALQITSERFERWTAAINVPAGRVTNVNVTLRPLPETGQ